MSDILLKSSGFLLLIAAAFLLKRGGMFKKEDGMTLSRLLINVTMPCALLSAGRNLQLSAAIGMAFLVGFLVNFLAVGIGYLMAGRDSRMMKGLFVINTAGFNVGSFALPFITLFFPSEALAFVCMFDAGNCIMNLGVNNTLGGIVAGTGRKRTVKETVRRLFTMPPFLVYILVIGLAAFGIAMPEWVLTISQTAASGNAFIAMTMIGLLLEVKLPKKDLGRLAKLLCGRYLTALLASLAVWFLVPLPDVAKRGIILCIVAPITSTGPVFTREMVGESDIPAAANSLSILISLALMTALSAALA